MKHLQPHTNPSDRIYSELRRAIEQGQYHSGARLPPIRELAKLYDTTFETARLALRRLEEQGVVIRRRGAGTFVAKAEPATQPRPRSLPEVPSAGIFLDSDGHLMDQLAVSINSMLHPRGLLPIQMCPSHVSRQDYLFELWQAAPPKLVITRGRFPQLEQRIQSVCGGRSKVVVLFRSAYEMYRWNSIDIDYDCMGRDIAQRLFDEGHRRIGLVTHARTIRPDHPETLFKQQLGNTSLIVSMGRTLRDAGLTHALTLHYNHQAPGLDNSDPFEPRSMHRLTEWLSKPDRPTAIFGEDWRMLAAFRVADKLGLRVPEDLKIVGFGNTVFARMLSFDSYSLNLPLYLRHLEEILDEPVESLSEKGRRIRIEPHYVTRS